jgi:FkbM family methyltransferase
MPTWRYAAKRALLAPRRAYMRRRFRGEPDRGRRMLEQFSYSRPFLDFIDATVANPDLLVDADLDDRSTVLDIGAHVGNWSERISTRYGSRVYAFEPSPGAVRKLQTTLADRAHVTVLPYGLGAANVEVRLSRRGPGSNIFDPTADATDVVRVRDVVEVLDELRLESVELCKVTIEGAEYDLLDRLLAAQWVESMRLIMVQFHEWHPRAHRRRRAIRRQLGLTHEQVWNYPWVWELWRRRNG